jgi:hypothetical protein
VTDRLLRGAFFPSRLFEFVLGIVLAIACLLGGLFDLAGNWLIKQGLKNTPFSS